MKYYAALKREEILQYALIWMNPNGHYAKWNNLVTKKQAWYDSIYMKYWRE